MAMRRNNITFLIILALFIIAAVIVFPLSTQDGGLLGNRPVKLGVDLNGGTSVIYKADLSKIPADQRSSAMDADVTAIRSRVDALGVTEPVIDRLGEDRIRVVLPGIKDIDKAKAAIGQTALLEFGEVATDANDPAIKWKDVLGSNWKPAMATLNGQQVALTSSYFKQNTALNTDNMGRLLLTFEWNSDGSVLSKEITTRLYNNNKARLGIFSGDKPLPGDNGQAIAPSVNGIITDKGEIEGLSQDEAQFLSKMLNAGRLQVPLSPGTETTVGTALGDQFVNKTLMAAIIGLVLVMLFMIIYYRLPGVLAALALLFYAMINLAIFKMVPVTLSLAGIGGFIVSMGMAVDANILIFERMKEELRAGRTVGAAIEAGFKRAWAAILDCNVTTFIACIVMYILGSTTVVNSSLVTGFALTLFIGVAVSMFSAITVTRTLLRLFIGTNIAQKTALFTTIGGK
jgi:preprotein translocase subunit SecD